MTYKEFASEWRSTDEFCIAHTSGSTGRPKEIRLPKRLMTMSALRTLRFFGIRPGSRLHSCISPDFIGGKMMAVRALEGGMRLTWEPPSNRPAIASGRGDEPPAMVSVVPSQMLHILDSADQSDFRSTIWLIGGQAIDQELRRRIAGSGLRAWESYGMTETASHVALRPVTDPAGPFRPLEGVSISTDDRGCLVISQTYMDTVATNDIARILPDGGFCITGRADNVIITGGRKVQPEEVEERLLPLLRPLGATSILLSSEPDPKWGRRLVLLMEIRDPDATDIRANALREARRVLEPHEVPKEIRTVAAIPRTPNGKPRRNLS